MEKCDQEYLKVVRESGQVVFGRRYGGVMEVSVLSSNIIRN